jgi:hypothetical protein
MEITDDVLSQLNNNDLQLIASGDIDNVSIEGLQLLSGQQPTPVDTTNYKDMSWTDVATSGFKTSPESGQKFATDTYEALSSPIQTGEAILDLASGALQHALPEGFDMGLLDPNNKKVASLVGKYYIDRYGNEEGFKKALATDAVGTLADIATALYGGGAALKGAGLASKIPAVTKTGNFVSGVGTAIDPMSLAIKGAGKVAKGTGAVGALVSGLTSGTGGKSILEGYKAGLQGGQRSSDFAEQMRQPEMVYKVVDEAKQGLQQIKNKRSNQYKKGMDKMKNDKTILSFDDIDTSLINALDAISPKGIVLDEKALGTLQQIIKQVELFRKSDNPLNHTADGFDDLKQNVGNLLNKLDAQTDPNARRIVGDVYQSIRSTIEKQAPDYSKIMKDYMDSSDLIFEIEKTLSMGSKSLPDTTLRKLQSIMRNNANTGYGARELLSKKLGNEGTAQRIESMLSGQMVQPLAPRGAARISSPGAIVGAGATGGMPGMAGAALLSSPRVAGEVAHGAGTLQRYMNKVPNEGVYGLLNFLQSMEENKE